MPSHVKAIALVVACVPVELFSNSPVAGLVTVTVQLPVAGITAETFTGVGTVTSIRFGATLTPCITGASNSVARARIAGKYGYR